MTHRSDPCRSVGHSLLLAMLANSHSVRTRVGHRVARWPTKRDCRSRGDDHRRRQAISDRAAPLWQDLDPEGRPRMAVQQKARVI